MGKRDRSVSIHARRHVREGHKYEPRCRDYLPISSGTQWRHEIHQGNKIDGSKQLVFGRR